MIGFRHADRRVPFLSEGPDQPVGRWHGAGDGPAHYFADTPDGAWAEFLRHEEITSAEDLVTIERALWAVDLPDERYAEPRLPLATLTGERDSYRACQEEARRLIAAGALGVRTPSAALKQGGAAGWRVENGLQRTPPRDGAVVVLFGPRPDLVGWRAAEGRPSQDLLSTVRQFAEREIG